MTSDSPENRNRSSDSDRNNVELIVVVWTSWWPRLCDRDRERWICFFDPDDGDR